MVQLIGTLSGMTVDLTLTLGGGGNRCGDDQFEDSRDKLARNVSRVTQGVVTGHASGSGTFAIPHE